MTATKHMPLPEWDKKIAPLLGAIKGRAVWIKADAKQIEDWIKNLPAVPEFETQTMEAMIVARDALDQAAMVVSEAILKYRKKPKVT